MERVFPIRCAIIDDSPHLLGHYQQPDVHQQPIVLVEASRSEKSDVLSQSDDDHRVLLPLSPAPDTLPQESPQLAFTKQAPEYAFTGQGHEVVTGERDSFIDCEDEPIRIPGAVQSHGLLLGLEPVRADGSIRYLCRVVSENAEDICKYTPRVIFGLEDFLLVFPVHQRLIFQSHARSVMTAFNNTSQSAEPRVFSIGFMDPGGYIIPVWCAMHFVGGRHNLLVCEFELEDSLGIDKTLLDDLPSAPYNTLDSNTEDAASSFTKKSEPLNIAADTVNMFQGEGRTMEVVNVMSQIQQQLTSKDDIQELLDTIVGIIQDLTGFHRIMVYRFDADFNGEVVSELINPQASSDIYRGLHFPASDIPKQARELYKINKVRVLFDREQPPSRLICRSVADLESPLDLTHSYLRAMSPVHVKYLANMGVRSTMSVSLNYKNELWGLICCHSYGPTGARVAFPVRELCYWVGLCASNCVEKLVNTERLKARDTLLAVHLNITPRACISASSEDLLRLFGADFGFVVVQSEARTIGKLSSYLEAVTLLRYAYFRNFDNTFATTNVARDFPDLVYETGFDHIAGLLCIPLSQDAGDFILLFRRCQVKEVHWAGNPNMSKVAPLEPRNSFVKWTETVKGTCAPWSKENYEAAGMTRLVYGNFIRVWREKEAALHDSHMKRLLLRNLSHEVRTPLNAVINYLEMALEKPLDNGTKDILAQSHSASRSLIYVIDDLLHLAGGGRQPTPLLVHSAFDIGKGFQETLDQVQGHAIHKSLGFDIIRDLQFPQYVYGDLARLQQAVFTLVTNAVKSTETGGIFVHLGVLSATEKDCVIQITVQDTGKGMSERELDDLFQDFEQVSDEAVQPEATAAEGQSEQSESENQPHMDVGLALLARYVKHCDGQIRATSVVGKGSTFSIEVPMQVASENAVHSLSRSSTTSSKSGDPSTQRNAPRPPGLSSIGTTLAPPEFYPHLDRRTSHSEDLRSSNLHLFRRPGPPEDVSPYQAVVPTETTRPKENLRILIADDNSINLAILQRRLGKMGHEVISSRDGQECFEEFQKHRGAVDFILMDLNMPLVDGKQSTTMIRAFERSERSTISTPEHGQYLSLSPQRPEGSARSLPHKASSRAPEPSSLSPSLLHPPDISSLAITHPPQPPAGQPLNSPPLTNCVPPDVDQSWPQASYFPPMVGTPPTSETSPKSDAISPLYSPGPISRMASLPAHSIPLEQSSRTSTQASSSELVPNTGVVRHTPIFAVSASLDQHTQENLESLGFDGWLSKPIDFKRLGIVLDGTVNADARAQTTCAVDDFQTGGWFVSSEGANADPARSWKRRRRN